MKRIFGNLEMLECFTWLEQVLQQRGEKQIILKTKRTV